MLADHRRVEDLLIAVIVAVEAVDVDRTATEWAAFGRALTAHLDAEDHYLIPALSVRRPRDAQALLQEHRYLRGRVLDLDSAIKSGALRADTARSFVDELSAHVRRETSVLYDWVDDELDASDRDAVLRAVTPTSRPSRRSKVPVATKL